MKTFYQVRQDLLQQLKYEHPLSWGYQLVKEQIEAVEQEMHNKQDEATKY